MRTPIGLVLALTLATAGVAIAQPPPGPQNTYDRNERERERYDRYDRSRWHRNADARWVTLASGFTGRTDRQFIPVNGQSFSRIRIEAIRGAPLFQQVTVIYTNGVTQKIALNARLARGNGEVLRVNQGPIQRIVVYTDPRYGGTYSLYGGRGRGDVVRR